jgi:hypothetical protein
MTLKIILVLIEVRKVKDNYNFTEIILLLIGSYK